MGTVYGKRGPSGTIERYVTEGLIMYLDAGIRSSYSGSGTTWYDLTSYNHNATISGTSVWDSTYNGQFDFGTVEQTSQYISLPAAAAQLTSQDYTIEFWMAPIAPASTDNYFCSMAYSSDTNYFLMTEKPNNFIERYNETTNTVPFTDGVPMNMCIVRNSSNTGTLYKNGVSLGSSSGITQINLTTSWILNQEQDSVGGGFQASQCYFGSFMVVKLYNIALTQTQIQKNFNVLRGRFGI